MKEHLPPAAQYWNALMQNPWDFLVVIDADGVYRAINHTAPGIRAEDLIGSATPYDFIPPADVDRVRATIDQAIQSGAPTRYEVHVPMLEAWFVTYVCPVVGADGAVDSLVLHTRDLSGLKRAEADLRAANAALRRHRDALDELVAERTALLNAANERLLRLAQVDDLTGLLNRREILERLEQESGRVARYGGELSILLIDLDHFKRINDTHGHQVGDRALQMVGRVLEAELRAVDLKGRYGGEEFLVLMPSTDAAGAARLAERVRSRLADAALEHEGVTLQVRCSVGVASSSGDLDANALVRAADEALYAAKAAGRDRVVCAPGAG